MEKVEEVTTEKVFQYVGDKEVKTIKYKAKDGSVFNNETAAQNYEKYLDMKSKIKSVTIDDSLFSPEAGTFYYFESIEDMDFMFKHEFDDRVEVEGLGGKRIDVTWQSVRENNSFSFPGWYYLRHWDGGDHDFTVIIEPKEVMESIKSTLDAFTYMSAIADKSIR